jgi:hypothetical protein
LGDEPAVTALFVLAAMAAVTPVDAGVAGDVATDTDGVEHADAGAVESPPDAGVARLRGRVLAKGSLGAVPSAVAAVKTAGGVVKAEVDEDGWFDVPVGCGELALSIRAPGYEMLSTQLDACAEVGSVELRLVPRPDLPIYETVVNAEREQPSIALRGPELTTTAGALGDPLRTIESLPGVAAVAWPAPIYAIRGSNPGNTGYFLDQLEVPLLFHLALGPSVIHPYFFDSMSFYPGGYPVELGRYVAGAVATETRAARTDRTHAAGEARLYDAGALVSVPFPDGNGAFAAACRYSYTGTLLSLLRNDVQLSYWDYQLRADRRVGTWQLTLLAFGSADDLDYRVDDKSFSNEYKLQFHRFSLRGRRSVGQGQLTAQVGLGYDSSLAPIVQDLYFISASSEGIFPRVVYRRTSGRWDTQIGADGQLQWYWPSTNVGQVGKSDLGRHRRALFAGGFASATFRPSDRLTATAGLRWDSYTITGTTLEHLDARVSARLALDATTWLTGSGGTFSQPPSLGVQLPAAQNFGLSLYGLQTSWQGALGVGTKRLAGVELEATTYLQRYVLTDLRDPTLNKPDPLASDFLVRRDARSYGLELMLRRPATERLHGWISYTLSQNERALGGGVIGPSDWDQRHILNAVASYRLRSYTLGARVHYNSGRPVLVNGASTVTSGAQPETFVRLPAFYQLDLRAERRFLFDAFTLTAYVEIVNATVTREVYGLKQDSDGEITQRSLRVFLPSLGVRGEM